MRFGTFKSIDLKKNWYIKDPVVPRSLMLQMKSCFCYLIRKFAFFVEKNDVLYTAMRSNAGGGGGGGGLVSRDFKPVQFGRRACMPTIHRCV